MRYGTFFCWLFGHKFTAFEAIVKDNGLERIEQWKFTGYCVRCGIARSR